MTQQPINPAPHKPADDSEVVYFEGSPCLRGEIGRAGFMMLLGCAIIAGAIYASIHFHNALWLIAIVLGLVFIFQPWLATKAVRYRITNYRIDFERGVLSKRIDTMELWHVEDIQFYQTLLNRMFGVGDITVLSHDDTTPRLTLRGLPEPRPIFDALKQRVIAVKRQQGVIKMDPGT